MSERPQPIRLKPNDAWSDALLQKPSVVRLMSKAIDVLDEQFVWRVRVLKGYLMEFDRVLGGDQRVTMAVQELFNSSMTGYYSAIRDLNESGRRLLRIAREDNVIPGTEIETREKLLPQLVRNYTAHGDEARSNFAALRMRYLATTPDRAHYAPQQRTRGPFVDEDGLKYIIDEHGYRRYPMC